MTSLQAAATPTKDTARLRLRTRVGRSVLRGRRLVSLGVTMFTLAALLGGLFVAAVLDALWPMPVWLRLLILATLVLGTLGLGCYRGVMPWLTKRFNLAAGEQIDRASGKTGQAVLHGLSMRDDNTDDPLARSLRQRAEQRAAGVADNVQPNEAYPAKNLTRPAGLVGLAFAGWAVFAILFPNQFAGLLARVTIPWSGAAPFSLTILEPEWSPEPPDAGDDVTVSVTPGGLLPEQVDFVRLDDDGKEAERFEMLKDEQGTFTHTLHRVDRPITFHLETRGRPTRDYTITPTMPEPIATPGTAEDNEPGDESSGDGSTSFNPEAAAQRAITEHPDWPELDEATRRLLEQLKNLQARAETLDPANAQALAELVDQIEDIEALAEELAERLAAMQGQLPPDAAAMLAALQQAVAQMQTAGLPAAPTPAQTASAAEADQQRIAQGLGESTEPTDSGTTSGTPETGGPDITDPGTSGTYDEQGTSGENGPLPAAVMQQVPPRYRPLVTAYFNKLAEPQPEESP